MSPSVLERMNFSEVGKAMLVTGLVLLASAAALLFSAEAKLRHCNSEVQRATAAVLRIEEINALVIGVDYSARGYALTGMPLFLEHEHQKQARLADAVDELDRIVNPAQRPAMDRIAKLVGRHAAVYAAQVAKGPNRTAEMAAIITDPAEREKRYDVLTALEHMKAFELKALAANQRETEEQMRHTTRLTVLIVALAFLGGTSDVMARLWRERRRRDMVRAVPVSGS